MAAAGAAIYTQLRRWEDIHVIETIAIDWSQRRTIYFDYTEEIYLRYVYTEAMKSIIACTNQQTTSCTIGRRYSTISFIVNT